MKIQHIITIAAMVALPLSAQTPAPAAPATTPVEQTPAFATPAQVVEALMAALTRLCDTLDACTPENAEQSAATVRESIDTIVKVRTAVQSGVFNMDDLLKAVVANEAELGKRSIRMDKSVEAFMERAGKDTTGRMKTVISPEELYKAFGLD